LSARFNSSTAEEPEVFGSVISFFALRERIDILFYLHQKIEKFFLLFSFILMKKGKAEMDTRNKIRVGIIGGASPEPEFRQIAYELGKLIAEKGAILVCGGLSGIMEAAARGAKQSGGLTVGILPGTSLRDANPHIDIPVATGLGYTRNSLVALNADVLIAVDGQFGTLSEIAYGHIYGKKVIGIGTWDIKGVIKAATAEEAVELAFKEYFPLIP
jgi:uncharacterized protein (TIGR00725 family)